MPSIEISPEEIRAAMAVALNAALTPEQKASFVEDAIRNLLTANRHSHTSDLQDAFRHAASEIAREVIRAEFNRPEVRAQVAELVTSAMVKVFAPGDGRDTLEDRVASAIGRALMGERY